MNGPRRSVLLLWLALCLPGVVSAKPWWLRGAQSPAAGAEAPSPGANSGVESNEGDFLDPEVAFRVASRLDGNVLRVRWVIADGYYLYRSRMAIEAQSPDLVVSAPAFPSGTLKSDAYLGTQEIFLQQVEATLDYTRSDAGAHPLQIKVTYQGCATAGLCYPPITKVLFPTSAAPGARSQPHPWEGVAILGGGFAFLAAGLLLRKQRRLDTPAS